LQVVAEVVWEQEMTLLAVVELEVLELELLYHLHLL
tara:strand:+ start:78 stop:185 length:108 start_codon:yes stop_codon:yes gene_type:complete